MAYHHVKDEKPTDSWYIQIGRLKRVYPQLTNKDLNYNESQKDNMLESLGKLLEIDEREILDVMYRIKR